MEIVSVVIAVAVIVATALFLHAMSPDHTAWIAGFAAAAVCMVGASFMLFTVGTVPRTARPSKLRTASVPNTSTTRFGSEWERLYSHSSRGDDRRSPHARLARGLSPGAQGGEDILTSDTTANLADVAQQIHRVDVLTDALEAKVAAALDASASVPFTHAAEMQAFAM